MTFVNWFVAHWGYISAAVILFLKWTYNSWTPGVGFLQFVHNFIGEIIQESPQSTVQRQIDTKQLKLEGEQVVNAKS